MNKAELVAAVAEKTGFTKKDAELAVNAFVSSVENALVEGEKVQLIGFGTFEVRQRKARQGRNPRKPGEIIKIDNGFMDHYDGTRYTPITDAQYADPVDKVVHIK